MASALSYRRLRAPSADGARLIEPPVDQFDALLAENRRRLASHVDMAGRPLATIRQLARLELLTAARRYSESYGVSAPHERPPDDAPILLAGHQPQLFHPGVWFKNFALSALAQRVNGYGVNLVIDSDTIKSTSLAVPTGDVDHVSLVKIRFDQPSPEIPFEERTIVDQSILSAFGSKASEALAPLIPKPLLNSFWPRVSERCVHCHNLGWTIAQARHLQETSWGGRTLELPQSQVCQMESFSWFVTAVLERGTDFRAAYNGSVLDYRRANHVRSDSHPVPELELDDDWQETPFWVWRVEDIRRRRLFCRTKAGQIELADRAGWTAAIPSPISDAGRTVDGLLALGRRGVKVRSRALATTMFARLVLGDLFVHGIGGAKYDEVTDAIAARFFGIAPPAYLTISATLRLPIPHGPVSPDDARQSKAMLRELTYHPERYLVERDNGDASDWIAAKRRWIAAPPTNQSGRERLQGIQAANRALQPWVAPQRDQWLSRLQRAEARIKNEALLSSREYPFCFFPEDALQRLMARPLDS